MDKHDHKHNKHGHEHHHEQKHEEPAAQHRPSEHHYPGQPVAPEKSGSGENAQSDVTKEKAGRKGGHKEHHKHG